MKSDDTGRPIIRKATARAYYLRISEEWQTSKKRVPSAVIADAEKAARAVLARHACQPKAHIKPPRLNRKEMKSTNP